MSQLPKNLKYAPSHAWAKLEDDSLVRVGISDFAQQELGDLVYIDLPKVGRKVEAGEQCAVLESVKTASDLPSPVTGEIVAINDEVDNSPEYVNDSPYEAWLFCVKADNLSELDALLNAEDYQQLIAE
jgi:glycine cleavage system H protein